MADITPRDINIFRILSSGPTNPENIRQSLEKIVAKTAGDEHKLYSNKMSLAALIVRINKLKDGGYLQSARYRSRAKNGRGVYSLYSLTPQSRDVLVENKVNPKHIRFGLPNKFAVSHELQVVDVVRTIKKESAKLAYDFEYEDENTLKTMIRMGTKGAVYPDLHVVLIFDMGSERHIKEFAVEVDNDTMHPPIVAAKAWKVLTNHNWATVLLCPTTERIEKLSTAFIDFIEKNKKKTKETVEADKYERFYNKVFMAPIHDFASKGFLGSPWLTPNRKKGLLSPKKSNKSI